MGMDGVEIVMKTEEAFDIAIDDSDAEKCMTPRDVIDLVMGKVGRFDQAACLTQRSFHRLRRTFMDLFGVKRSDFRLDVQLEKFLHQNTRKPDLVRISERIECDIVPSLILPRKINSALLFLSIALGLLAGFIAHRSSTDSVLLNFVQQLAVLVGFVVMILVWKTGVAATKNLRTEFPQKLQTVRDLSRWLVAHNPALVNAPPGQWSHEQIAERIREIVIEVLGCEKTYREDARFVEDLGLS